MNSQNNNYCVILAGGRGRRLWPCSRTDRPKQFIDFFGTGRTQLQQTFDRMSQIMPKANIYISTNQRFSSDVEEQLPELPKANILAEPIHRNTAPSVAWATHRILHVNPDANIIVAPSDQAVFLEEKFIADVGKGFDFVSSKDCLLTLGVKPTRPEPGYGYIQMGEKTDETDVFRVKTFTEKPERELAGVFMDSGEFLWNTGLFMSNARYLRSCFSAIFPEVLRQLDKQKTDYTIEEEQRFIDENFPSYPHLSIDYGILEQSQEVFVMSCDFGWADLGTWHSIYEAFSKTKNDNVILDSEVILDESQNNIIKLSEGKLGVINGLDGFIVIEQDNVLLICRKEDSSSRIKKYIAEAQMRNGKEFV